ncbi:carbohydrate ABC transporter permease [Labrys wisconsinensis]|uniref:Raffinose/stachyose/melibiose transport system permease protein n=1 Tax=Labrys wisconsinensis TaxID=425677 RepID=A0ABU0JJ86_9HYPH|nr:carbohydrate ABC transporter permease [Labrys wisconsinensis]MDQ0473324.1 raffinose/stachyose/melibiose transport system permease protein [Labrys wisconsinensis]
MTELALARPQAAAPARSPFHPGPILRLGVLLIVAAIVLVPLLATALGGFKDLGDLRANPFGLPARWVWANYWDILASARYWRLLGNSLIIAGLTVALTLTLAALAAFAFAHLRFFGERFLLAYLLIGMMFPAATAILPIFIKVRNLGLLDTAWGVVLPQVAFGLGMAVLLLRNAFRQLPSELLDAALVDGCGYVRYFLLVTLPLSLPILATVAIVAFVGSWNNYLLPLILLNSDANFPWPLGLMAYQGEYSTAWQLVLAFITLTILPAILMFLLAQKYIVAGLTAGAVKG